MDTNYMNAADFGTKKLRQLKARHASVSKKCQTLEERIANLETAVQEKQARAQAIVEALRGQQLSDKAIRETLAREFGVARKAHRSMKRQSRKLDGSVSEQVIAFVQQNNGVSMKNCWEHFPDVDRASVAQYLRAAAKNGVVRAEGNTRQRKYFAQ